MWFISHISGINDIEKRKGIYADVNDSWHIKFSVKIKPSKNVVAVYLNFLRCPII